MSPVMNSHGSGLTIGASCSGSSADAPVYWQEPVPVQISTGLTVH